MVKKVNDITQSSSHEKNNNDSLLIEISKTANPIFVIDHDGNYIAGNKAACNFLECSLEKLLSKNIRDYSPSILRDEVLEYHQKLWQESGTVETDYMINGKQKTLMLSISPGYYKNQKAIYGFGIDITEQIIFEKKLVHSEQRFKWLYDSAPIPYHILTPDGVIEDVNQKWCEILGYIRDEVIGKEIFDFIFKEERSDARVSFIRKKSSKQSFMNGSNRRYVTKDGDIRIFRTFDNYLYDENQNPVSIQTTIEDFTDIKRAEERQERNLNRLKSLVNLFQLDYTNTEDFLEYVLIESINLTSSKAGFIYFYNLDTNQVEMKAWYPKMRKMGKTKIILDREDLGPVGEPILQERPVIMNDYQRSPTRINNLSHWHININKFLGVPAKQNGKVVAVIGVSNKVSDYDESDALQLSLLMESAWRIKNQRETIEALSFSETTRRNLINATKDFVILKDNKLRIIMFNQAALTLFNLDADHVIGKTDFDLFPLEIAQKWHALDQYVLDENRMIVEHDEFDGKYYEIRKFPVSLKKNSIGVGAFIRDITRQVESDESIKLQTSALEATANSILIMDSSFRIEWVNPAFTKMTGYSKEEAIGQKIQALVRSGIHNSGHYENMKITIESGKVWKGRMINHKKDGSLYHEEMTVTPLLDEIGKVSRYIAIKQDVSKDIQREKELLIVANVSSALRSANTRDEMFPIILDQLIEQLNVEAASLTLYYQDADEFIIELGRGLWEKATNLHIPANQGIASKVLHSGEPYLDTINGDTEIYKPHLFSSCKYLAAAPLIVQKKKLGLLFIGSNRELQQRDINILTSVADIASNAIHRSTLHERTEEKVRQLNSLRVIDTAINTSLDLRVTLDVVLRQAKQLLQCGALTVLLSKTQTMWMEPTASLGFNTYLINDLRLHIGSSIASKSILERDVFWINRSEVRANDESEKLFLEGENFETYYTAPLIVKSEVKGVLVVFYRDPVAPDSERIDILNTLATQIAIAIDNAELFNNLKQSTMDLRQAYNETIEGWAKALELRDQKTQGHSRRVTDLTLILASKMGIKDKHMGHIMRGALLHDIGKMGIPDTILNKPGKLTAKEWEIVRKHPGDAFRMLSSIKFLQPALDIPYCHHEKWNGTGYPRGLQGEKIPLAARIFAIVDVWDALISDRPYRKAWPKLKARDYILEQSGKHFDPKVVKAFIQIINAEI